ncbi:MAG: dihydrolipoyl dehydrogenase [Actinomycetota bacterium]
MVVGEVSTPADVLVIGGGPGGYAAALRAAGLGRSVILAERDAVGGTCLNVGCIPSKVLIHAAELANLPAESSGTGVTLTAEVDVAALQAHMADVVAGLTGGVRHLLDAAGVTVVPGTARFARPNRAVISDGDQVQHVEFDQAIVATGSRPIELPTLPFDGDRVVDSTGALFGFDEFPASLVVVGGGYIGVELGTAWAKLGVSVTLVEARSSILPDLDPRLGRVVARRLRTLGVEVLTGTVAAGLDDDGLRLVPAGDGSGEPVTVPAERVVVCVGRRPNTDDLGLDVVGVTPDDAGRIPVDASRRAAPRILAIGDVTAGPALAHKATAEAEVAARTAAGVPAVFDVAAVPAVVFSDPEVATVGMTAAEAEAAGIEVTTFVFPLGASSRARTLGRAEGQIELVADEAGTVIGAHLAGPHVSELIGEMTLAIEMAATAEDVAATIHPHPTMSEGLLEAAHGLLGLPLHVTAPKRRQAGHAGQPSL